MRQLIATIFTLIGFSTFAQFPSYFPNLTKVNVPPMGNYIFGYSETNVNYINSPTVSNVDSDTYLVATIPNGGYKLLFSSGESDDPTFYLMSSGGQVIETFECTEFYITSDYVIYTAGHTNNMFNTRRKYILSNEGGLTEVQQPYYYVGLRGQTVQSVTLYSSIIGSEVVATVGAEDFIDVLLCDTNPETQDMYYLVRTTFGLVGWMRLENGFSYLTPLESLRYAGD